LVTRNNRQSRRGKLGIIKTKTMNYKLQIKPLSVNKAWKGKRYKTDEYNRYIKDILLLLPSKIEVPDVNNIKLAIEWGFSTRSSDCSNPIKLFEDCLVKKYGFDDRYIYELHVFKSIVKKGEEYIKFKIY